ncbi:ABC transporter substrate-binding protein [Metabacillus sediminilitoris]|uniref:ABC transporter substrate-binding protein n=1 Tax=Metabacillus sediminilitoris TaxID=2567941 RepID=A0A4S4BU11_9BACI|nr:ABC transporter substrate-binding protein [Metabacillus sediminilitoris]QGQ44934.1 PhnD/SsuA/transferrin family substrate-binding protein [Metabacillus sediminilitoris]THF78567.1 ABC transporter substrate-binding protein [Metabacillus sediminilitoris]
MKAMIKVLLVLLLAMLTACNQGSTEPTQEDAKEKEEAVEAIRVASWSQPITEQTNLLVEEEKGFFKEQGLNMSFIPGAGGGDAIKNILSGQADIAFTDPGSLFFALDKGEKLRVIYNVYPQNVFNIVSLKEKNMTKPEDLKGKTIGVYSLSSGTRQNLLVLLHEAGLTEDDVKIVETGILNFAPLMQGQVDATAATDTGLYTGKQKGLGEVNVMEVKDFLNFPSDVFVVTEETYQEKKELLQSFLTGYKNSAEWMLNNPDEAASLAVNVAIDGKDQANNLEIIKMRNASSVSSATDEKGLGSFDIDVLQKAADTYQRLGLVKNRLNMDEIVTEELIPKK